MLSPMWSMRYVASKWKQAGPSEGCRRMRCTKDAPVLVSFNHVSRWNSIDGHCTCVVLYDRFEATLSRLRHLTRVLQMDKVDNPPSDMYPLRPGH